MEKFENLAVGDTFDWIAPHMVGYNSFFLRCEKISRRRYRDSEGMVHQVGSVKAIAYNVKEAQNGKTNKRARNK